MVLGEHRLQGAQPLRAGVDEQCEWAARPSSVYKLKANHEIFVNIIEYFSAVLKYKSGCNF